MRVIGWQARLGRFHRAPAFDGPSAVPRDLPTAISPIMTICLSALIIALIFLAGIRRGMDHVAAYGPESEQTAISIALSEGAYGLHFGYLGYASVRDALVAVWNQGARTRDDPIIIQNNKNGELLNKAILAAATLGPQQPGFVGDGTLITTLYDDMGYVDYVKLSFRLFGQRIEAMYYTFFVLLSLSTFAFMWVFRDSIAAQTDCCARCLRSISKCTPQFSFPTCRLSAACATAHRSRCCRCGISFSWSCSGAQCRRGPSSPH